MQYPPSAALARPLLDADEAGAMLGLGRGRVYQLVNAGSLPAVRLGRRLFIPARAIERLAEDAMAEHAARHAGAR